MSTGTVKFYNTEKGYGFIIEDTTKQEAFVHAKQLNDVIINDNDRVEFDTEITPKGLVASNIKVMQ
jgi:cold shock protein